MWQWLSWLWAVLRGWFVDSGREETVVTVAWQASGVLLGGLTTADVTPVIPAHQTNDILICITANRVITNTCATPSGWTLLTGPDDETAWRSYVFWKRATSGAETNPLCDWTATSADKYAQVHTIRGAITTGNPFAATAWTDGAADPAVATGVTTAVANQKVFTLGLCADNLSTSATVTATDPSSFTVRSHTVIATGADATGFIYDAVRTTAGATGNVSHDFNAAPLHWGILVAAVTEQPPRDTAPTMVNSGEVADWHSTATPRSAGSVSWQTGDVVVVHGVTADATTTLGTPTVSGLTFTALPGSPTGSGSSCLSYAWSATAASNGSGAIQGTMGGITNPWGIAVEVWRGSDGIGAVAVNTSTTKTVSLTRTDAKSAASYGAGDWSADPAASTFTPSGATVIETDNGDSSTYASHVGWWGDQGAAGTTSYGISSSSAGSFAKIAVEILGTISGAGPTARHVDRFVRSRGNLVNATHY